MPLNRELSKGETQMAEKHANVFIIFCHEGKCELKYSESKWSSSEKKEQKHKQMTTNAGKGCGNGGYSFSTGESAN